MVLPGKRVTLPVGSYTITPKNPINRGHQKDVQFDVRPGQNNRVACRLSKRLIRCKLLLGPPFGGQINRVYLLLVSSAGGRPLPLHTTPPRQVWMEPGFAGEITADIHGFKPSTCRFVVPEEPSVKDLTNRMPRVR